MNPHPQTLSPNQIREIGVEALTDALGPVGMVRFLRFFETGIGNYSKERETWLNELSIRDITEEIKEKRL